jgi:response regulator RpfG family c-di-GMP phosphodiesterase
MLQPFPVVALMKAKPLTEIDEARLTVQFTRDIADILRLTRDQKRVLRDAALQRAGEVPSLSRLDDFDAVMRTVLYATERWDGRSRFPGVLGGEDIPIESRVLAVASAWAALTAGETHRLPPQAAIASIGARAGTEFDPRIVAAAAAVADYRIVFRPPSEQAAEPRLALP